MKPWIKIPDILIISLAAALTVFSAYAAYMKPQGKAQVLIRGQSREWVFQIDVEETVVVNRPLGDTVVRLDGSRAWVESSPCENQTCTAAGFVSRQGQWAVCLPNNVLLMISGTGDKDVDAVSW